MLNKKQINHILDVHQSARESAAMPDLLRRAYIVSDLLLILNKVKNKTIPIEVCITGKGGVISSGFLVEVVIWNLCDIYVVDEDTPALPVLQLHASDAEYAGEFLNDLRQNYENANGPQYCFHSNEPEDEITNGAVTGALHQGGGNEA